MNGVHSKRQFLTPAGTLSKYPPKRMAMTTKSRLLKARPRTLLRREIYRQSSTLQLKALSTTAFLSFFQTWPAFYSVIDSGGHTSTRIQSCFGTGKSWGDGKEHLHIGGRGSKSITRPSCA